MVFFPVKRFEPQEHLTQYIGGDVVTFDAARWHYHTMPEKVFEIFEASDGTRTAEEIAQLVFDDTGDLQRDAVAAALLDLMEDGLIEEDSEAHAHLVTRRTVAKAAIAVLFGGVGLPLVRSITAPESVSAQTIRVRPTPIFIYEEYHPCHPNDETEACASEYCCCCNKGDLSFGSCRKPGECSGDYTCVF